MHRIDTICILYNGGAYGTYLEWALTTLTSDTDVTSPLTPIGNSHLFQGNFFNQWQEYVDSGCYSAFVRLHPKIQKTDSLDFNCNAVASTAKKTIYIYPEPHSVLLTINNYYTKVWADWWDSHFTDHIPKSKIYQNWPVDPSTPIEQVPDWIKREFLSHYLVPAWHAQVEWYHPDRWSHPDCLTIGIRDLLDDFEITIDRITQHCNLKKIKSIDSILPIHDSMLKMQKFITQDQLCNQIVESIVNDTVFDWQDQNLPLPSQAWLQWELRNRGFEIQCHGLDLFPTNTVQLQDLLYHTHESI